MLVLVGDSSQREEKGPGGYHDLGLEGDGEDVGFEETQTGGGEDTDPPRSGGESFSKMSGHGPEILLNPSAEVIVLYPLQGPALAALEGLLDALSMGTVSSLPVEIGAEKCSLGVPKTRQPPDLLLNPHDSSSFFRKSGKLGGCPDPLPWPGIAKAPKATPWIGLSVLRRDNGWDAWSRALRKARHRGTGSGV
jgi:hypothetical protein